jgi:hypothetical protein
MRVHYNDRAMDNDCVVAGRGSRRLRRRAGAAVGAVGAALAWGLLAAAPVAADHGAGLREAPLTPLATGLVSGGLALGVGLLILVIVMLLSRGEGPPAE